MLPVEGDAMKTHYAVYPVVFQALQDETLLAIPTLPLFQHYLDYFRCFDAAVAILTCDPNEDSPPDVANVAVTVVVSEAYEASAMDYGTDFLAHQHQESPYSHFEVAPKVILDLP